MVASSRLSQLTGAPLGGVCVWGGGIRGTQGGGKGARRGWWGGNGITGIRECVKSGVKDRAGGGGGAWGEGGEI